MYKSFLKCIKINTVHLINCSNVQSCNRVTVFLRLGLLSGKFFVFAVGARPVWRKQAKGSGVNALVPSAVSALAAPESGFGARCPRRLLRSAAFPPRSAWLRCGGARPSACLPFCVPGELRALLGRRDHGNKGGLAPERMN